MLLRATLLLGLALSGSLTLPGLAWGGENTPLRLPSAKDQAPPQMDSGGTLLKMAVALAFTVLVIWVCYRLLRLLAGRTAGRHSAAVEVLSRTELERDLAVYVLRLGDTVTVVSRSGASSTVLREMTQAEAEASGLTSAVNPSDQRLRSVWTELRGRLRPASAAAPLELAAQLDDAQTPMQPVDLLLDAPAAPRAQSVEELLDEEQP